MPNRKPLMAGNWKMHKTHLDALAFVKELDAACADCDAPSSQKPDVVICAPFTSLMSLANHRLQESSMWSLGAQTMDYHAEGAYTGEISAKMLQALGVSHVIIGHSERRQYFNETDDSCREKLKAAFAHNLTPILCVGETLEEREAGQTDVVVMRQTRKALESVSTSEREKLVIAYEPIWAIGTGKVCEATEANRVISIIRRDIGLNQTRILYGGSMKPDNVEELMQQPDIDGGLVGGASLQPDSFVALIKAAAPKAVSA